MITADLDFFPGTYESVVRDALKSLQKKWAVQDRQITPHEILVKPEADRVVP